MDTLHVQSLSQLSLHLKSLRKARSLTQAQLANRLKITQGRYAQIERNPGVISTGQLLEVLTMLGTELHLKLRGSGMTKPARGEDW